MQPRFVPIVPLLVVASVVAGADAVSAGGGRCGEEGPVTPVAATEVAMAQSCFAPGVVAIAVGDTVRIVNDDPVRHNVYGPGWFHGDVPPGETASRTFDEAGTYTFACTLHPGMTGAVVVTDAVPIAATAPAEADRDGTSAGLVAGIGGAVLAGAAGWALGRVTGRRRASGIG